MYVYMEMNIKNNYVDFICKFVFVDYVCIVLCCVGFFELCLLFLYDFGYLCWLLFV